MACGAAAMTTDLPELEQGPEPNTAGELIRRVRLFHGWTQDGYAALFRVSRRTIIRWEERGAFFADPELDAWHYPGKIWRQIHARFEAAARYRLTPDGVVEVIGAAEGARLDPVTLATRGALEALERKRHTRT